MTDLLLWWIAILIIGIAFMPLTASIFKGFKDGGWIFSKTIGILVSAFVMWGLNVCRILSFTSVNVLLCIAVTAMVFIAIYIICLKRKQIELIKPNIKLIAIEEAVFMILLAAWIWMIGFKPEIYQTEKFMDYGFITTMIRSLWMPFEDFWFCGNDINYYYGGQFITAFLIRITNVSPGTGYNLMRATIAAFSFSLPAALSFQMFYDRFCDKSGGELKKITAGYERKIAGIKDSLGERSTVKRAIAAGTLSGVAVAFGSNMFYLKYRIILPLIGRLKGSAPDYEFWFPNATRYIGYFPETADKTISEFPSYSSILGDLHAHYINLIFTITVLGILYAWAMNTKTARAKKYSTDMNFRGKTGARNYFRYSLLCPEVIMLGLMTGLFRWLNFWDYPIYMVITIAVIFFVNIRIFRHDGKMFWGTTILQAVFMFLIGKLAALPFTLKYDQINSSIGMTYTHSPIGQLMVLWGVPIAVLGLFVIVLIYEYAQNRVSNDTTNETGTETENTEAPEKIKLQEKIEVQENKEVIKKKSLIGFFAEMEIPDLFTGVIGACAAGLVFLPELIYVKDIYTGDYYRANTMFKLTYQAFIIFGIICGYILVRMIYHNKSRVVRGISIALAAMLIISCGYTANGIKAWFGNVFDKDARIGSDGSVFVSQYFEKDFGAVCWLNENVAGTPVILEANDVSYSDYGRISVATGLPTVLGWYTHEWLWHDDLGEVTKRSTDIETMYTSSDGTAVRALLDEYKIKYIYIGSLEREKFTVNDALLQDMGKVVYSDDNAYIIEVG